MRTVEEMLDEDGGLVMDKTTATVTVFFITVDQEEAEAMSITRQTQAAAASFAVPTS